VGDTPLFSGSPETGTATIQASSSRFSPVVRLDDLTADYLKTNYLMGFTFVDSNKQELSAGFFEEKIANAIAKFEDITQIDVLQRAVVGEKHDYHTNDYMNYAFMQLFRIPATSVSEVRAVYPTGQVIQVYPTEWCRLSVEHGQFHLVPTSGSLAQVMLGGGNGYMPFIFGGISYLPQLWEVDYLSGFAPDAIPRGIVSAICKIASIEILTIMSDLIGPLGVASASLGIDGMSQSMSRQLPAFKARIDAYKMDLGLPGYGLGNDPKFSAGEIGQLRRMYFGLNMSSL